MTTDFDSEHKISYYKTLISNITSQYNKQYDLGDYFEGAYTNFFDKETLKSNTLAYYNFNSGKIYINIDKIIAISLKKGGLRHYIGNIKTDNKFSALLTSFTLHELNHARQNKYINTGKNDDIRGILMNSKYHALKNRNVYNVLHDLFPLEHEANATSIILLAKYLKENNIEVPENIEKAAIDMLIKDYYIDDGELVSPAEQYFFWINESDFFNEIWRDVDIDTFTNLSLGLPISLKKYKEILKMSNNSNIKKPIEYIKSL